MKSLTAILACLLLSVGAVAQGLEAYESAAESPEGFPRRWVRDQVGLELRDRPEASAALVTHLAFATPLTLAPGEEARFVDGAGVAWVEVEAPKARGWIPETGLLTYDPLEVPPGSAALAGPWETIDGYGIEFFPDFSFYAPGYQQNRVTWSLDEPATGFAGQASRGRLRVDEAGGDHLEFSILFLSANRLVLKDTLTGRLFLYYRPSGASADSDWVDLQGE